MASKPSSMSQDELPQVDSLVPLQLNSDIWSQVLLPKLIEQGSAAAVALACSRLRDVTYQAVNQIDLSTFSDPALDAVKAKWMVHSVPQRFPGCTSVQLCVNSKKACVTAGCLLPALKMLPSLNDIRVTVAGPLPLASLATLLHSMHKQLTHLQSLSLFGYQQGWAGAERVWQALGRFKQLTGLVIRFYSEELDGSHGMTGQDLEPLRTLRQLQSLKLQVCGDYTVKGCNAPMLSERLLQPLTALTSLNVNVCTLDTMVCVSVCTGLQELAVNCDAGDEMEMTDVHWHALRKLTRLTSLKLANALVLSAPPACFEALQRLHKLQKFRAWGMSAPLLPALAACTQLTCILGAWSQPASGGGQFGVDTGFECVVLATVFELEVGGGAVPFAAFPNLQNMLHTGTVEVASWHALTGCCIGLCDLDFCLNDDAGLPDMPCSLPMCEPIAARVACLQSFTRLHHLQNLTLSLSDNAELVALASVVGSLVGCKLNSLYIVLPAVTNVTMCGLSHLSRVRGIHKLALGVLSDALVSTESDAFMVLCALSGAESAMVELATSGQKQVMDAAWAQLKESGLPQPGNITIRVFGA